MQGWEQRTIRNLDLCEAQNDVGTEPVFVLEAVIYNDFAHLTGVRVNTFSDVLGYGATNMLDSCYYLQDNQFSEPTYIYRFIKVETRKKRDQREQRVDDCQSVHCLC